MGNLFPFGFILFALVETRRYDVTINSRRGAFGSLSANRTNAKPSPRCPEEICPIAGNVLAVVSEENTVIQQVAVCNVCVYVM